MLQRIHRNSACLAKLTTLALAMLIAQPWQACQAEEPVHNSSLKYESVPLPGQARFSVVFETPINSTTVRQGDGIKATLEHDLVIDGQLIAAKGSTVLGHIGFLRRGRKLGKAMLSKDDRFNTDSVLNVVFDEIVAPDQKHYTMVGMFCPQVSLTSNDDGQKIMITIGRNGQVKKVEDLSGDENQETATQLRLLTGAATIALGPAALLAVPLVMGAVGAVDPSIVTSRPVNPYDPHPIAKGFILGATGGTPLSPIVQSFLFKGSDINIQAGDVFMVEADPPLDDDGTSATVSSKILGASSTTK